MNETTADKNRPARPCRHRPGNFPGCHLIAGLAALVLLTLPTGPAGAQTQNAEERSQASARAEIQKLVDSADRLKREKNYEDALQKYRQALALLGEHGHAGARAAIWRRIGSTYRDLNQPATALASYQKSLTLIKTFGKPASEARVLIDMGIVYRSLGNYPAALAALDDRDPIVYGRALNNLALNLTELGQYSRALEQYHRALSISEPTGDLGTTAAVLHNTGLAHSKAGNPSEALRYYDRALQARERISDEIGMASTLNNMGFTLTKQDRSDEALELLDRALALARRNNAISIEGRILDSQGDAYARQGEYANAQAVYHEALAIREQLGDRRGERVTLANIGRVFQEQGEDELATVFYKWSVNVSEAIRGELDGLARDIRASYTQKVSEVCRRLADLLLQNDRVAEAQQVLDLLKLQELEEYSLDVRGSPATRRGLATFSGEQQIVRRHDEIFNRFIEMYKVLSDLERRKESLSASEADQLKQLTEERKQFSKLFKRFTKSPEVRDWKKSMSESQLNLKQLPDLQDNLAKLGNTVVFYPLVLEDRLELIVVTAFAPSVRRVVEIKRKILDDIINRFRSALVDSGSDPLPLAQQLYDLLIRPLRPALDAAAAETIIYAPDRGLRYIPLSALHDGRQWLVERYKSHRITTVSLSDLNTRPSRDLRIVAGAFSSGDLSFKAGEQNFRFSGLPFARLEIEALAKMIPSTKTIFDGEFTPKVVEQEANFHTVIHLATHAAFLGGHPDESFILFGNGERLTLLDVEDEWSGVIPNVELVVLSACETAVGGRLANGDEILGFGALMEEAGAEASMATLWAISDGGTQVLMNTFYQGLYEQQATKAEALQKAQIMLIRGGSRTGSIMRGIITADSEHKVKGRLSHPYYWSPFILIGNGL